MVERQQGAVLHKAIRLPHATSLVVGTIVGASIFVQPSEITSRLPSAGWILVAWVAAGLLSLLGALICAEYARLFTSSGGVYVFLREAFSPALAFLWGWAMFWVMHSGIIAAIAVVCARYLAYFHPLSPMGQQGAAVLAILLLSWINYRGVRPGTLLQTSFTAGKVGAILILVAAGFLLAPGEPLAGEEGPQEQPVSWQDLLLGVGAGLFAFGGWHMVTYSAEETVQPSRTVPRALVAGMLLVTLLYVLLNGLYLYVLPLEQVARSTRVAADVADVLFGSGGGWLMAALVVFSCLGSLSGIILAGPRVYLGMARDGLLFRSLARIHPHHRTPHQAILLQALWSSVLVMSGTYRSLFAQVIYTEWLFFALLALGIFRLGPRHSAKSRQLWGYPFTPLLFALASLAVAASQVASDPSRSLKGLALVLAGLPAYWGWRKLAGQRAMPPTTPRMHAEKDARRQDGQGGFHESR